jgi:hypothetical protein
MSGHVITASWRETPAHRRASCTVCGAATIEECPACGGPIGGVYRDLLASLAAAEVGENVTIPAPAYCPECGCPYPWTQAVLDQLRQAAGEASELTDDERQELADGLESMVRETSGHQHKAKRVGELLKKAGVGVAAVVRDIFVEVSAEVAKKQLGL